MQSYILSSSLLITTLLSNAGELPRIKQAKTVSAGSSYTCNYAIVSKSRRKVNLRFQASASARVVATLKYGTPLYICDEIRGWNQAFFAQSCSARYLKGLHSTVARRCKMGWIRDGDIEVISG